jgi:hypothetical protein
MPDKNQFLMFKTRPAHVVFIFTHLLSWRSPFQFQSLIGILVDFNQDVVSIPDRDFS